MLAKYMMDAVRAIVDEVSFACGQPKVVRSYDGSPAVSWYTLGCCI